MQDFDRSRLITLLALALLGLSMGCVKHRPTSAEPLSPRLEAELHERLDHLEANPVELISLHRGPGPCLRYGFLSPRNDPVPLDELDPEEVSPVVEAFLDAEIDGTGGQVGSQILQWNHERESRAHRRSRAEEVWSALTRDLKPALRRRARLELRPQLEHRFPDDLHPRILESEPLGPDGAARLRRVWEAHLEWMGPSGWIEWLPRVGCWVDRARMNRIEAALIRWWEEHGEFPLELADLGLPAEHTTTFWGDAFDYHTGSRRAERFARVGVDTPGPDTAACDAVRAGKELRRPAYTR